jgi:hypothetical protein
MHTYATARKVLHYRVTQVTAAKTCSAEMTAVALVPNWIPKWKTEMVKYQSEQVVRGRWDEYSNVLLI